MVACDKTIKSLFLVLALVLIPWVLTSYSYSRSKSGYTRRQVFADNRRVNCSSMCLPCASDHEQLTCGEILAMNTISNKKFSKKFKRKVAI